MIRSNSLSGARRRAPLTRRGGSIALRAALAAALVGGLFTLGACSSVAPPFGTSYEGMRGFKARTFIGTPDDVRPAVVATLQELGYEVLVDGADTSFLSAVKGMGTGGSLAGGQREWTRVGVQIRHIDKHRRAPRTLVEVEAERMQGSAEGPIEASFGQETVASDFYSSFFDSVRAKVDAARPRPIFGLRPPA